MRPEISIVIPIYNEADNIPVLIQELESYFEKNLMLKAEIIFVNDGSTDNSIQLLRAHSYKQFYAKLISFSKNFGSHSALRAGVKHSSSGIVTFLYADLQDPIELVKRQFERIKEGYDIVWATREQKGSNYFENIFSGIYNSLMKRFVLKSFPDNGFDVVMFNEKIKNQLLNNEEKNSSIFVQVLCMGFRQSTILYKKEKRKLGRSKWTLSKKIKLFIDSFVAFSFFPIRFVTIVGILLFILGLIWTIYIVLRALILHDLNAGWPSLIAILLLGFGITNISLGIIAEYLWRTLDASRKRPVFIIDEIIELDNEK